MIGSTAFIANGIGGLLINNITALSTEHSTIINPIMGNYKKMDIINGIAYVIIERYLPDVLGTWRYENKVAIINVTNPSSPQFLTITHDEKTAWDLYVSGNLLYIADLVDGLFIYNVSDPRNPEIISNLDLQSFAHGIFVNAEYAYIAGGNMGLTIINVTDSFQPVTGVFASFLNRHGGITLEAAFVGHVSHVNFADEGPKFIQSRDGVVTGGRPVRR